MSSPVRARAMLGAALLITAAATTATGAAAPEHPHVVLLLDGCLELDQAEVRRIVGVELGALLTPDVAAADTTRVWVRCSGGAVVLHVDDPITHKALERAVDLSAQAPNARPRLLALAIAEFVTASWTELEVNPTPRVPPLGARPSLAAREAAREVVRARTAAAKPAVATDPLRLVGAFSIRSYPGHTGILVGGLVRMAQDRGLLAWSLDASGEFGTEGFGIGSVDTTTLSLAPSLLLHWRLAPLDMRAGVGLRGGLAIHSGQAASADVAAGTVAGAFGGPMAVFSASVAPRNAMVFEVTVDGGWVTLPVISTVGSDQSVAIQGAWIGATLGVGVLP